MIDLMSDAIAMHGSKGLSKRAKRQHTRLLNERFARAMTEIREQPADTQLTRRERLEMTAAGHPDRQDVQAARRLLAAMDTAEAGG
jgi:hypothetical protein